MDSGERVTARSLPSGGGQGPREFLKYTFYHLRPEWRLLPANDRRLQLTALAAELAALGVTHGTKTFSLVGLRGDCHFMTWTATTRAAALVEVARRVASTPVGAYLDTPHSYLAMRRKSTYLAGHEHAGQEGAGAPDVAAGRAFLFVYPFTKKREWYAIPFDERRRMMAEHFRVGHKYPDIAIHTGYSFGLDDWEFVLAFEADDPGRFLDLVEELRTSDASRYTAVETPIFACMAVSPEALADALGGVPP